MKIAEGVRVTSFVPGRVRLRFQLLKGNTELAQTVKDEVALVPGIKQVEASEISSSILVVYDKQQITSPDSVQALITTLKRLFPGVELGQLETFLESQ
ncbi:hypothetical protein Nhal_1385 [Nitrosococcus halophilus Nc 4]|uniref:Heavy metal translocating P-type ATPase n=1 Tax=Nitrosococcus halophilus (strain Nc4) TaxID=472759 RepID=D5C0X9_NITHN|nr:hypothetical protein [Nitrosococcus halophilus]ADE14536.1 hypothetical protein Nhal_1385 [Nitrosococcus halophilus Nc 4]